MKLDDSKEGYVVTTVELYEQYFGEGRSYMEAMHKRPAEEVLIELRKQGRVECRLGSKWDSHSVLWLMERQDGHIEPMFVPNFDPREDKTIEWGDSVYLSIEKANREFAKAAGEYLN